MILPLCYYGNPILRKKAQPVEKITDEIRQFVQDMVETMDALHGIGLAATQVGKLLRIIIIRPVEFIEGDEKPRIGEVEVFINPKLSAPSEQIELDSEGCLSIPKLHADIERPVKIHVEALDLDGKTFFKDYVGFVAREVMHENDHLNGRLFIDLIRDKQVKKDIEPILKEIKEKYSIK